MRTVLDNYENIKDYLQICMFDPELHPEYNDRVVTKHGDFSVYYRISLCENSNHVLALKIINEDMLTNWGISVDQLKNDAFNGVWKHEPVLISIINRLNPFLEIPLKENESVRKIDFTTTALTNESRVLGAGLILNETIRARIGEFVGGDYIVLPSSIHEVIIYKDDRSVEDENFYKMVEETNQDINIVEPCDVLSNKVQWCSEDGTVMLGLREARKIRGYMKNER